MKILLDHCIDWRFARLLPTHDVKSTQEMGWEDLKNGRLLAAATAARFDLFLTVDRNLKYQQNLTSLPIAVIVLVSVSNTLKSLAPHAPRIEESLKTLQPRTLIEVSLLRS